jgi:hypothetical protein
MGPILAAFLTSAASAAGSQVGSSLFGQKGQQGGGLNLSGVFEEFFKQKLKKPGYQGVDYQPNAQPKDDLADNPVIRAFLSSYA